MPPQGRSFYGFVRLLLDPARREEYEEHVGRVLQIPGLDAGLRADPLLQRLFPRLRAEQEKVGASTQRLAANLRRALETARLAERRRVRELIGQIQTLALKLKENSPTQMDVFEVEEMPEVWPALSRPLWMAGMSLDLDAVLGTAPDNDDMADFSRLSGLPLLMLESLRANVETCLKDHDFVLLTEVLERFPATQGVLEVLGYLILATHPPHYFASDQLDRINLGDDAFWNFPRVMFCRNREEIDFA